MYIEKCQKCNELFHVSEHNLAMPGTKEKEPISCPYCGYTIERISNGWWNTRKLTEKELEEYKKKNE